MTSAQIMRMRGASDRGAAVGHARFSRIVRTIAMSAIATLTACESKPALTPPVTLSSPYPQRQVWAVAPFLNESGVSDVAGDQVADAFTTEAEQINGIDTLPVNRVIAAMRRLNLQSVTTPAQARALLNALGCDGLIVGTVTQYDPYDPMRFGAAVALFTHGGVNGQWIDPVQATRARTDTVAPGAMPGDAPAAQASDVFIADNNDTLKRLQDYAAGRSGVDSAFGDRIYLVRIDLYTQFAAYGLLQDLLDSERARLLPVQTAVVEDGGTDRIAEPTSR